MIASILAWVNALLGFLLMVFAFRYIRQENSAARWIKALYGVIGLYWFLLYLFVALTTPGQFMDSVIFAQTFVRPAFTVTLAVMAGGAIYRWRSR